MTWIPSSAGGAPGICICVPCPESHGPLTYGGDCCMATGIVEYDADCPLPAHRVLAEKQFPSADRVAP